jgi:hypothetical protein
MACTECHRSEGHKLSCSRNSARYSGLRTTDAPVPWAGLTSDSSSTSSRDSTSSDSGSGGE